MEHSDADMAVIDKAMQHLAEFQDSPVWPRLRLSLPNFGNRSSFNAVVQLLRYSVSLVGTPPTQPLTGTSVEKTFYGLVAATDSHTILSLARLFYRQLASEHWQYFVSCREQDPWSLMCVLLAPLSLLPVSVRELFSFQTAVTFSCNTCSALSMCTEVGAIVCMLARECATLAAMHTAGERFSRVIKNVRRPCEICGRQYAQISLQLLTHPPLLVVCFRAGKYHRGRGLSSTERDYQDVELDPELPFDGGLYRLVGVITRYRSSPDAPSGYLCFQRHADSWYEFSDDSITSVSWQHVYSQQTYIHVYQRIYCEKQPSAEIKIEPMDTSTIPDDEPIGVVNVQDQTGDLSECDTPQNLSLTNANDERFRLQNKNVVHIKSIQLPVKSSLNTLGTVKTEIPATNAMLDNSCRNNEFSPQVFRHCDDLNR